MKVLPEPVGAWTTTSFPSRRARTASCCQRSGTTRLISVLEASDKVDGDLLRFNRTKLRSKTRARIVRSKTQIPRAALEDPNQAPKPKESSNTKFQVPNLLASCAQIPNPRRATAKQIPDPPAGRARCGEIQSPMSKSSASADALTLTRNGSSFGSSFPNSVWE